jgi:hypothetical protein
MSDFINKVITVILIFVMLVLAPLLISYMSTDMLTERLVLNDVSQFIDKVTDKFLITEHDINDLYLAVNSHGQAYDITIERYQLLEEPLPDGSTKLIYIHTDDMYDLMTNEVREVELVVRDIVKVHVEEVSMSPAKRMLWTLLHIDKGKLEFSLAGTVR